MNAPRSPSLVDTAAEAAVLSAAILSPILLDELRDALRPGDFWLAQHRILFEALLALDDRRSEIDAVTITHELQASGNLQAIGGAPFLALIMDATPAAAHALEHARIVRELGELRRMKRTLQELLAEVDADGTRAAARSFLEQCEARVFELTTRTDSRETAGTLAEVMAAAHADLTDPSDRRRGVRTGLQQLDELTLGLVPGELWYLAARPGQGKTALAMGIAEGAAAAGAHAVIFSLEMGRDELGQRMLSAHSGVWLKRLQKREMANADWAKVTDALQGLSTLPIVIDDMATLTPSRLRSRVRRHASRLRDKTTGHGRLGLVVVDYVQLMIPEPSWRGKTRNDEIEAISRALKLLAKEFDCTVLALSQLNRGQRDRADKRPSLADLRGSGALEQDADKVVFIHRDEAEGEERGEAEIILGKGRNAESGSVSVRWEPWCVRFRDSEQRSFGYDG